ncbi:MAG TPA: GNAT family N-acetyltransferase [Gemmatimonadaceae bacterium]|nr:GNAT family N-acetyltransferase [Gemmatimonadaceae bacterium]
MRDMTLFPLDQHSAEALSASPEAFADRWRFTLVPSWPAIVEIAVDTARFLAATQSSRPWGSYLALDGPERRLVGACGFKGNPDAGGAVEIAYFTFPGEEGRGVATAMASALVELARVSEHPPSIVRAHTLPERNASVRVLEKNGFRRLGEVMDPEDGLVWRWERVPGPDPRVVVEHE